MFCITDLLPHLGAEQNDRKLSEGIKAEELNVLIGSDALWRMPTSRRPSSSTP